MRAKITALFFVVLLGCHTTTPEGSELFLEELETRSGLSTTHTDTVMLGALDNTTVKFVVESVDIANEKHIARVTATVVTNAGGWEVTKAGVGNPVNVGSQEKPVMSVPFTIQRYKVGACGRTTMQHQVKIRADGTIRVL